MIKAKPLFLLSRRSTPYWDADDKALNWGKRREEPLIARTTPGWACPQGRGDLPNSCLKLIQPFMGITCNSCGSGQAQEMSSPSYFTPFSAQYFLCGTVPHGDYFAVATQYIRTTVVSVNVLFVPAPSSAVNIACNMALSWLAFDFVFTIPQVTVRFQLLSG